MFRFHPFLSVSLSWFLFVHFLFLLSESSSVLPACHSASNTACVTTYIYVCVLMQPSSHFCTTLAESVCVGVCVLNNTCHFLPALQSDMGDFSAVNALSPSVLSILAFFQFTLSPVGMKRLHTGVCVCVFTCVFARLARIYSISVCVQEDMKVVNN